MKSLRKIMSISAICMLLTGALLGCSVSYTQDELNTAIENARMNALAEGIEEGKITGYAVGVESVNVEEAIDEAVELAINAV